MNIALSVLRERERDARLAARAAEAEADNWIGHTEVCDEYLKRADALWSEADYWQARIDESRAGRSVLNEEDYYYGTGPC